MRMEINIKVQLRPGAKYSCRPCHHPQPVAAHQHQSTTFAHEATSSVAGTMRTERVSKCLRTKHVVGKPRNPMANVLSNGQDWWRQGCPKPVDRRHAIQPKASREFVPSGETACRAPHRHWAEVHPKQV